MKQLMFGVGLVFLVGLSGLACTPDAAIRGVGLRNNCSEAVQVKLASTEASLSRGNTKLVEAGVTETLLQFGDQGDVVARWGPVGVELDESFPVSVFAPDELQVATEEEENEFGYEFYFVVEGDACP